MGIVLHKIYINKYFSENFNKLLITVTKIYANILSLKCSAGKLKEKDVFFLFLSILTFKTKLMLTK